MCNSSNREDKAEAARDESAQEDGLTRHLKHNRNLQAEKHIRIHGGFQWDLFQDKETGRDLPWAA